MQKHKVKPSFTKKEADGGQFYSFEIPGKLDFWFKQEADGKIRRISATVKDKRLDWIIVFIATDDKTGYFSGVELDTHSISGSIPAMRERVKELEEMFDLCEAIADFFKSEFPKIRIK